MKYVTFKTPDGMTRACKDDISYCLHEEQVAYLIMKSGTKKRVCHSLEEIQNIVGEEFFRIHKKCIINLEQDLHLCPLTRILKVLSNHELRVAAARLPELKKKLFK